MSAGTAPAALPWQPAARAAMLLLATAFTVLFLHRAALHEWYGRTAEERYSHAGLVLAVAAYLFWTHRPSAPGGDRTAWWGVLLTLLAGTGLLVGELSALWTIVQYSLLLTFMGIAWAYYGKSFRSVCFPFLLALTAIPLPYMVDVVLTGKMQLVSSGLGVQLLRLLDVAVHQQGNIIDLGSFKLHVAEACSGLNYMFPLFAIGLIVASFHRGPVLLRGLLVLTTVPITIFMNSARIATVGLLVDAWGSQAAEGFLHYFEGWVVFMLCVAVLLAEVQLANLLLPARARLAVDVPSPRRQPYAGWPSGQAAIPAPLLVAVLLALALSLATSRAGARQEIIPDRQNLYEFPLELAGWRGASYRFAKREDVILGLTDYLLADYVRGGERANLYIGYVQSQRKGFVPHSPKACMPGGGWEISEAGQHTFRTATGSFGTTRLLIANGEERQLVYYWFRQRGRDLPGEYSLKWYLLQDSIQRDRTDGALVRIVVPVHAAVSEAEAVAQRFVADIYPMLPVFVPD